MVQVYNTWAQQRARQIQSKPSSSYQPMSKAEPDFRDYVAQQQKPVSRQEPDFRDYVPENQRQSIDYELESQRQREQQYTVRGEQGKKNIERLQREEDYFASQVLNEPQLAMSVAPEQQYFTPYSTKSKEEVRDIAEKEFQSQKLIYESELPQKRKEIEEIRKEAKRNKQEILNIAKKSGYDYKETANGRIDFLEPVSPEDAQKLQQIKERSEKLRDRYSVVEPFIEEGARLGAISGTYSNIEQTKRGMFEVEYAMPENVAKREIAEKYEAIKPYLNEKGTDLNWQTKLLYGEFPKIGQIPLLSPLISQTRKLPWIKRDNVIDEYVVAQEQYETRYGAAQLNFDLSNAKPLTIQQMSTEILAEQRQKVTEETFKTERAKSRTLQSFEALKTGGGQTPDINFNTDSFKNVTEPVKAYETKQELTKIGYYGVLALLTATPFPDEAVLGVVGTARAGRIALAGLRVGEAIAQYEIASPLISTGFEYESKVLTAIKTNDLSYLYKDIQSYKPQLLEAAEAERKTLSPPASFINKYIPQLREKESRALLGAALFSLSKGKVGKIAGLGIAATAVPQIDKYLGNVEAYRASLKEQGLSFGEIEFLTSERKTSSIASAVKLGFISTQSEILGEKLYGVTSKYAPQLGISTKIAAPKLYGIFPVSEAFRKAYISTGGSLLTAGIYEGVETVNIQAETEYRKPTWQELVTGGIVGGLSARTIGGAIIGFSAVRPKLVKPSLREQAALGGVYLTDTSEYLGDITADTIMDIQQKAFGQVQTKTYLRKGKSSGTIDLYGETVTPIGRRRLKVPVLTEMAENFATQQYEFQQTPQAIDSRTSIYTPTGTETIIDISIEQPSPVSTPVSSPISTPVTFPVSQPVSSPVSTPVSSPISTPISIPITLPISAPVTQPIITPVRKPAFVPIQQSQPIDVPSMLPVDMPLNIDMSITEPITTDVPVTTDVPINIVVPKLPGLLYPLTFSKDYGTKKTGKKGRKAEYAPDFIALIAGITAFEKPMQSLFTGQEIRPIIVGKQKGIKRKRKKR